jgi:two-component system nitrogen regulation response regulator GlnG
MNPVWIIDDDRSIRWVFEKALAREGIAHRTFGAAKEALETLPGDPPQVVVSDIRMPGVSGLEFMQALKTRLPSTPVIIMTAYSDLESAVAAFQGGAFEYLPKPFDVDHAVELVRRAIEESRRTQVDEPANGELAEAAGDPRPRAGHAGGVPRDRPPRPFTRHSADHRGVGHRKGAGGARVAPT